jgi:hypothetical protein
MGNAVSTGAAAEDPPPGYVRASYLSLLKGASGVGLFHDVSKPPQTLVQSDQASCLGD